MLASVLHNPHSDLASKLEATMRFRKILSIGECPVQLPAPSLSLSLSLSHAPHTPALLTPPSPARSCREEPSH